MRHLILAVTLFATTAAGAATAPGNWQPLPSRAPDPADNPTTGAKVELGKVLYFDPRFSSTGTVSWRQFSWKHAQGARRSAGARAGSSWPGGPGRGARPTGEARSVRGPTFAARWWASRLVKRGSSSRLSPQDSRLHPESDRTGVAERDPRDVVSQGIA